MDHWDRPLAAEGFTSYRYRGRYGWIMIGARDDADAMREAARSGPYTDPAGLEVWDGQQYRPVTR
jgi:hypothetical protein